MAQPFCTRLQAYFIVQLKVKLALTTFSVTAPVFIVDIEIAFSEV